MAADLNILIGGAAGQGVHAITGPLAKTLVRQGAFVHVTQSYESRIRGGHLYNILRVSDAPVVSCREGVNLLVALNQETVDLHAPELSPEAIIIFDADEARDLPGSHRSLALAAAALLPGESAGEIAVNAGACGAILGMLGVPAASLMELLAATFADKGPQVVDLNRRAVMGGFEAASRTDLKFPLEITPPAAPRLLISGHEALALGALAGGLNFICGYPMTPWTSLLNAVSQRAARFGVVVEQTEDEIAAVNMAIGASFAGARALTGTSGGGFCLMTEGVGLAAMSETPLVVVVASRPGPSTGLPTRTSQGDLGFVLHAGQDDFPRAVLAPGTPPQGWRLAAKALQLAERYQTVVFLLTDQHFADAQLTCSPEDFPEVNPTRELAAGPETGVYQRYALTPDGISPRRLPGFGPEIVVADSDEHTPDGHLTDDLRVRVPMHEKRLRKLQGLSREIRGITTAGDPDAPLGLLCWGSSYGPAAEAVARLNRDGVPSRLVHLSELWPFPREGVTAALAGLKKLILVEANAFGHLGRLLRQETGLVPRHFVARYDGLPFTPEYILRGLAGQV